MEEGNIGLEVPWWAKALLVVIKFLPLPPWVKIIIPLIIQIIESIPSKSERRQAKKELMDAVEAAKRGDNEPLEGVVSKHWKRHCEGLACPSDVKE